MICSQQIPAIERSTGFYHTYHNDVVKLTAVL